jgi:hypothetical protein
LATKPHVDSLAFTEPLTVDRIKITARPGARLGMSGRASPRPDGLEAGSNNTWKYKARRPRSVRRRTALASETLQHVAAEKFRAGVQDHSHFGGSGERAARGDDSMRRRT